MNKLICLFKWLFRECLWSHIMHLKVFLFHGLFWCFEYIQLTFFRISKVTNTAFERFLMDRSYICIQVTFLGTPTVTHGAIKGLISFMQCSDMNFYGIFWRAVITANVTCFYVLWTNFIWILKLPFWENLSSQISHLKGFTFSWTDLMCPIKWAFLKLRSQMMRTDLTRAPVHMKTCLH